MTRRRRILNIIEGIGLLFLAALPLAFSEYGLHIVLFFMGISLIFKGVRTLLFYLSMARHMVGGKLLLYYGLFYLDAGILSTAVSDNPGKIPVIYVSVVIAFAGLIDLLRSSEARKLKAPQWKRRAVSGTVLLATAASILAGGVFFGNTSAAVSAYALGLVFSAGHRICNAFRRTAIAYIP